MQEEAGAFIQFCSAYTNIKILLPKIVKLKEFEIDFTDRWYPKITFYDEEVAFLFLLHCSHFIKK